MNLNQYKKNNEYYLPKSIFDFVLNEAKQKSTIFYGFDVFVKTLTGYINIEIVDFSNSYYQYDYAIELSGTIESQNEGKELFFVPVFEDDSFFSKYQLS
jgi:hypothetical protein